ncbi:MAG: pyridoxamine 5'-phosphate oxidase family protein [Proteobacteria bacterium]|jgi:pyridoxamine 5'-phosphate oxidase|nr:pyridoxamine 5'-phosphate oxidase family protein [Pseudomonadota bacterium]MDA1299835.1 pyridoxamine 5'-phosphate oxidase family protein [Pseudomonadota bacterium]
MNPVTSIADDKKRARGLSDPNADLCFLALADRDGSASVRTLVLRSIEGNAFGLFINRTSPKWRAIDAGARAQMLLWYPSVQRQYRISGEIHESAADNIAHNWRRRPVGSKYLDHVYETLGPQSSFIEGRPVLTEAVSSLKSKFKADDLPVPRSATGVYVEATEIERLDLNQQSGEHDRLHDRRLFTLEGGEWVARTMIP